MTFSTSAIAMVAPDSRSALTPGALGEYGQVRPSESPRSRCASVRGSADAALRGRRTLDRGSRGDATS